MIKSLGLFSEFVNCLWFMAELLAGLSGLIAEAKFGGRAGAPDRRHVRLPLELLFTERRLVSHPHLSNSVRK